MKGEELQPTQFLHVVTEEEKYLIIFFTLMTMQIGKGTSFDEYILSMLRSERNVT